MTCTASSSGKLPHACTHYNSEGSVCQLRVLYYYWTLTCFSLYAGSHTVLCLLEHGYYVTIIDNLDNAFEEAYRCASSTMIWKLLHRQSHEASRIRLHSSQEYPPYVLHQGVWRRRMQELAGDKASRMKFIKVRQPYSSVLQAVLHTRSQHACQASSSVNQLPC